MAYQCKENVDLPSQYYGIGNLQKMENFCRSGKKLKIPFIPKGW